MKLQPFARATEVGSHRHLRFSIVLGTGFLLYANVMKAGPVVQGFLVAVTGLLVAYNVQRIRAARRAARGTVELARNFASGQLRSHLVRGWTFLIACPVLLAVVWSSVPHSSTGIADWLVLVAVSTALVRGWWVWLRTVRSIRGSQVGGQA